MSKLFEEYTKQVSKGLNMDPRYDRLSHLALGLAGEAGEVADSIKKSQYKDHTLNTQELLVECGDVLWYLTGIIKYLGSSLEDVALHNIFKLEGRRGEPYNFHLVSKADIEDMKAQRFWESTHGGER